MLKYILSPLNLFVIVSFLFFVTGFIVKALQINANIKKVIKIFKSYKKSDLTYRFEELNETLLNKKFIANIWKEYAETLVFKDRLFYKSENNDLYFDTVTEKETGIYCTSNALFFFNEANVVNRVLNYKFIQALPGLFTGMGPLGTFLYIAMGFSQIDFGTEESTINSVSHMLANMEIAASCSILAIGSALIFIAIDKTLYYFLCNKPLMELQTVVNGLFTKIAPEKFLIELVKESKKQNSIINEQFGALSVNIKKSLDESLHSRLAPYLENIVFLLNKNKTKNPNDIINDILND